MLPGATESWHIRGMNWLVEIFKEVGRWDIFTQMFLAFAVFGCVNSCGACVGHIVDGPRAPVTAVP